MNERPHRGGGVAHPSTVGGGGNPPITSVLENHPLKVSGTIVLALANAVIASS
jgi:hypothetical protein